ncbi:TPA: hypothetical protein UM674_002197 [Stenotrophomonas maltophilia]|nr:hypothetical protein [Stenotrophomonas maltophilia]
MNEFSYSLLVVEDDEQDRSTWTRQIERHNINAEETGGPTIDLFTVASEKDAYTAIDRRRFDAAIIDLRLDGNGENPADDGGNRVLEKILKSEIAIAALFTGQPDDASIPEYARRQVRVITKGGGDGEGHTGAITWILENQSLIDCIRQVTARFTDVMAQIFHQSIWPRWSLWMDGKDPNDAQFLLTAVARHIASHAHDHFMLEGKDTAHPEEWYWVPARAGKLSTGDVVRNGDRIEIVVTPRCDLATQKIPHVQLVECDDLSQTWETLGRDKKATFLKNGRNHEHFIPKMNLSKEDSIGPLIVRFDKIRSVKRNEDDPNLTQEGIRVAAVSAPFLPSLVERLGNYYSRIGSPDYSG